MNMLVLLVYVLISSFLGGDFVLGFIGSERRALLEFKHSLFDPSNRLSSWTGQDCCTWKGVSCHNITRHVTSLLLWNPTTDSDDINKTALFGKELSPALAELKQLEMLALDYNNFGRSKIPEFLGSFKSLWYLSLSYAFFAGNVPHSLGNLSNPLELHLAGNELLRIESLTNLSTLASLDLSSINLSRVSNLPQVFSSLPLLSDIDLSDCGLVEFPLSSRNLTSLSSLDLSGNSFRNQVPNSLQNFTKLELLFLRDNGFSGQIPNWFAELKILQALFLSSNSFSGQIPTSLCNLSSLKTLFLYENQLSGSIPTCLGTLSNLMALELGSNKLNGEIPPSLGQLSKLGFLSLSNNSLSGIVSEAHFDKLSWLYTLDLSSNILVLNVSSNWIPPFQLTLLDLGSCQLGSRFPLWLQTQKEITLISMPKAGISGPIPKSVCGMRKLMVIDLSSNELAEGLPQDCWSGSRDMLLIDLSSNNLTGTIPSGIGHLSLLNSLHLSSNRFYGELPIEMKNCGNLTVLDVANNGFTGNIPSWIEGLPSLQILKLRSNKFEGSLIPELCQLYNLRVLDLGENHFTGVIPPCFENLDGMKRGGNMMIFSSFVYDEKLMQVVKGRELEYTKSLKFLVNLDLSNNHLAGEIPKGLTSLVKLSNINLSNNRLVGGIPNMIGSLKSLESLDFSQNHLSGSIPQSISDLGLMGYLNLSFNNLSGPIPSGHPQAFDASSYTGNLQLCGIPLEKKCSKDNSLETINVNQNVEHRSFVDGQYYIAMGIGVIVGFWGVCGVLLFREKWRYTYFRFIENMQDRFLCRPR